MKDIKFLPDTRKQDIVNALLSGQSKIIIDKIEIFLKDLKRDTLKNKEIEAEKMATKLLKLL